MKIERNQAVYPVMHLVFWCAYAIIWGYTAVYLGHYGYSSAVVGLVTGAGAVISVLLQPVLAYLVKREKGLTTGRLLFILKIIAIAVALWMWGEPSGKWTVAILFLILAAIEVTIPSMLSTLAMDHVNSGHRINYGAARGLGSVAYALASFVLGYLAKQMEIRWFALFYVGFSLFFLLLCVLFREAPETDGNENSASVADEQYQMGIMRKYPFLLYFLVGTVLLFMGHNMINIFLVNIIEGVGGSSENLGVAIAIAATLELPIMAYFNRLSERIDVRKLLVFSSVCFLVKCILTYLSGNLAMIYLAQVLQIGAFGLFTPASVHYINVSMKRKDSGIGQALLGAFSLGLGGALGNVTGGFVLERFGAAGMLLVTIVLSAAGLLFIIGSVCRDKKSGM